MNTPRDPNAARDKIFGRPAKNGKAATPGKTYLYAIPALYRYSAKFNEIVGHISTGDKNEDMKLMNEPVHIGGTIEDILKLFRDGVPITFRYPQDICDIYDTIQEHINNWIQYTQRDPNIKDAPLESLRLMEEFSEAVYAQAKGFKANTKTPSSMTKRSNFLFGGMSREQQVAQVSESKEIVARPGLMDKLEALLSDRNPQKN